jgi:hypothetical protein
MSTMTALLLSVIVTAGADAPRAAPSVKALTPAPGHGGQTACAACHSTTAWSEVRFNHERTGFPLTGEHAHASCKGCHVTDFKAPLPRTCVGCHADVHAGDLGARCEGCHDTKDWRSRFDADAHRRTNFPLLGAHAALPCTECHAEARERRFARAAVDCAACHQTQVLRTAGQAVDHLQLGFAQRSCRECHSPLAFTPARYPAHDGCFPISTGPHAGIACRSCHTSVVTPMVRCQTNTATLCVPCHSNGGNARTGSTDAQHRNVPGYTFSATKCAQCHKGTGGTP